VRRAVLVAGLGYGDEGKGASVDYLSRSLPVHTVVRYNGGAQAAHNVVTAGGRHHTFAQFGSGSLVAGVQTYLSRFVAIDPPALLHEGLHLQSLGVREVFARTAVDARCPVITPFQRAANRLRELARGDGRHGSCGVGFGETVSDHLKYGAAVLLAGDLATPAVARTKLGFLQETKAADIRALSARLPVSPEADRELRVFRDPGVIATILADYACFAEGVPVVTEGHLEGLLAQPGAVVFEGAQGVLLDERYGFHPYTTWSTTTFANAETLLMESRFDGSVTRLGVIRAYATRHGPGPLVTEDVALIPHLPEPHNRRGPWQRDFRVGHLDLMAARYAREVIGPLDGLAVTHVDRLNSLPEWKSAHAYACDGQRLERLAFDPAHDLARQERLTEQLMRCWPSYQTLERGNFNAHLAQVAHAFDAPVALVSRGPTASDWEARLDWERSPEAETLGRPGRRAGRSALKPASFRPVGVISASFVDLTPK
jgi:adenylosuccinate synthase